MNYFDRLQEMATKYCDAVDTTKNKVAVVVEEFMLNMYGFNTRRLWAVNPLIKPSYKIAVANQGPAFEVTLTSVKVNFKSSGDKSGIMEKRLKLDVADELNRKFPGNDFKITLK